MPINKYQPKEIKKTAVSIPSPITVLLALVAIMPPIYTWCFLPRVHNLVMGGIIFLGCFVMALVVRVDNRGAAPFILIYGGVLWLNVFTNERTAEGWLNQSGALLFGSLPITLFLCISLVFIIWLADTLIDRAD